MINRRKPITVLISAAAVVWPVAVGAQQSEWMRRIGVLMSITDGPEGRSRLGAS